MNRCPCSCRNPVENAFLAFVALSDEQKAQMCDRFSAWQSNAARPQKLTFEPAKRPAP